jgi:hypothetical protein
MNPVENAVRHAYYLMNFFLECGHLSPLCWMDMALAAVYVMNRLPHPQSKVRRRRAASPYELVYRRKPDLSDLIAGPGELVVVDWIGAKASAGEQTGEHCYYIMPSEAGHLVRSFRTGKTRVSKSIRTLSSPRETVQQMVSLRHTMKAGTFRDGSGLEGSSAAAVASAGASLLADEVRRGGSSNPDDYFVLLDPVSGQPLRLVLAKLDGVLARVEVEKKNGGALIESKWVSQVERRPHRPVNPAAAAPRPPGRRTCPRGMALRHSGQANTPMIT